MLDLLLHAAGGALLALVTLGAGYPLVAVPIALTVGIGRESHQRGWANPLDFSAHAWREACAWGVGALAVLLGSIPLS